MSTLTDSFIDDLDELGGDSDEEEEDENIDDEKRLGGGSSSKVNFAEQLQDLDDSDDDDGEGDTPAGEPDAAQYISPELQALIGKIRSGAKIDSIIQLRNSNKFKKHLNDIADAEGSAPTETVGRIQEDNDYKLIVASNKIVMDIGDEIENIHRFVAEKYAKKFPELESLIPSKLDYILTVQRIGNEMDLTLIELNDLLPSASVMVVSVTGILHPKHACKTNLTFLFRPGSTTSGQPLAEADLQEIMRGCEEIVQLEEEKNKLLLFIEGRMCKIAPNICILIGSRIAAQLIGITGGLVPLSKIPSCNLQVVGQEKKYLSGFSKISAIPHSGWCSVISRDTSTPRNSLFSFFTGILYYCELVQNAPPFLRKKMLKIVAAKVTLMARVDSYKNFPNGEEGRKLRRDIEEKMEALLMPQKAKTAKALPIPEEKKRSKRGGKRVRKWKERYAMTDIRKAQNKMGFSSMQDEYGDSAMGVDTGLVGTKDSGRLRAPQEKKVKLLSNKKAKTVNAGSSGGTNGLSSTLVFSTVQGMELMNPSAAADRVKEANSKWFNTSSGFLSAAPGRQTAVSGMVLK